MRPILLMVALIVGSLTLLAELQEFTDRAPAALQAPLRSSAGVAAGCNLSVHSPAQASHVTVGEIDLAPANP